jgi:hypothetical protein
VSENSVMLMSRISTLKSMRSEKGCVEQKIMSTDQDDVCNRNNLTSEDRHETVGKLPQS